MKNLSKEAVEKEIFALDVTGYSDWTENNGEIIANLIAGAPTLGNLIPMTGVKAGVTAQMNILSTDVTWSATDCIATETGDNTVIAPREVTTTRIADREILCLDNLDAKLPMIQSAGARNEELPFAQLYMDLKVQNNSKQLEKLAWLGDTAGAGNLALTNGFLKIAAGETGSLAYTATFGAGDLASIASFSNDAIGTLEIINNNLTAELDEQEEVLVFMSLANAKAAAKDIRDTYGLDATGDYVNSGMQNQNGFMKFRFPGTNLFICGTHGFNSDGRIFATYQNNLRYATDLESDREQVDLFYDKYHKSLVSDIIFTMGFQYQDPSQVIYLAV